MKTNAIARFQEQHAQWEQSQKGQTNGYEYERSFLEMWMQLGQQVFQDSVGELPRNKNEKKTPDATGKDRNAQAAHPVRGKRAI